MATKTPVTQWEGEITDTNISNSPKIEFELLKTDTITEDEKMAWKPSSREWLVILCLCVVSLVVALDFNILAPVLPALATGLSGTSTDTFWAGTSYVLTCAVFQPFIVSLSDIFGRRGLMFSAVLLFTIGSAVCCSSHGFPQLLTGRAIQGVGGGGIQALGLVIITDIIPLRSRPTYYGIIQMAWAIGTMTGPLAGGLFAEHVTWRWVFYINFPFCAIGLGMVPATIRLRARTERGNFRQRISSVDWIGGFLFVGSTSSFLIGISWGGQQFPWNSYQTIVPIVLGIGGVIVTAIWELYVATAPFLRLRMLKDPAVGAAYFCALVQGLLMFCLLYSISLYLQACRALTPTLTGVGLMGMNFALLTTSILTGRAITKLGKYNWAIWSGWVVFTGSIAIMIALDAYTPHYGWALLLIPLGVGCGLLLISLNFSIQALVSDIDGAYAAGMYTFARTLGMCLGVTVGGTTLHNFLKTQLEVAGLNGNVAEDSEGFILVLNSHGNAPDIEAIAREAYAAAFRNVFEVLVGISVLGTLVSLVVRHSNMDRTFNSEHVFEDKKVDTPMEEKEQSKDIPDV